MVEFYRAQRPRSILATATNAAMVLVLGVLLLVLLAALLVYLIIILFLLSESGALGLLGKLAGVVVAACGIRFLVRRINEPSDSFRGTRSVTLDDIPAFLGTGVLAPSESQSKPDTENPGSECSLQRNCESVAEF